MRFSQLEVFEAVYKHNSISRASEELIVTQPAVSIQLRSLEDEVGVKLFERVGRTLKSTPAGDMLFKYATDILNLKEEAESHLEQFRLGLSGQIVLGVATGVLYCISGLLSSYKQTFANIKLVLQTDIADRIRESTVLGKSDFGLVWGPIVDARLESVDLVHNEFVFVVPSNHELSKLETIKPEKLAQYPMVFPPPGTYSRKYIEDILRNLGITPKISVELPTTSAMKWAVTADLGIGFLSLSALQLEIASSVLSPVRIEGERFIRPISIIQQNNHTVHSATMDKFKNFIIDHPYWKINR